MLQITVCWQKSVGVVENYSKCVYHSLDKNLENVYRFRPFLCNGPTRVGPSLSSIHHKTGADSKSETFWVLAREDRQHQTAVTTVAILARYARRRVKAILSIDVGDDMMRMMILFYKDRVERGCSFG